MIGSKPTHLTPAFSHDVHAGRFWSHLFLRSLQRLHADTLRKEEVALELLWDADVVERERGVGVVLEERDGGSWEL